MHTSQVSHQFHGSVKVHPGSFRSCDVDWVRPSRPSKSSGRQTLHAFDDVFEVGVGGFVPANVALLGTLWPSGGRMLFAWQGTVYFATDMIVIFEDTFMATSDFKSSFINHQATTSHNVCQAGIASSDIATARRRSHPRSLSSENNPRTSWFAKMKAPSSFYPYIILIHLISDLSVAISYSSRWVVNPRPLLALVEVVVQILQALRCESWHWTSIDYTASVFLIWSIIRRKWPRSSNIQ